MNSHRQYLIQPASAIKKYPSLIPEESGVYAFVLDDPTALDAALERSGLVLDSLCLGSRPIIYLGSSNDSIRRRVGCHLSDDTRRSTLRMSLGALMAEELQLEARAIPGRPYFCFEPASEAVLSAWINRFVSVAVRPTASATIEERRMIVDRDPLLNINGRRQSPSAWTLLMLRRRCQGLLPDLGQMH